MKLRLIYGDYLVGRDTLIHVRIQLSWQGGMYVECGDATVTRAVWDAFLEMHRSVMGKTIEVHPEPYTGPAKIGVGGQEEKKGKA